MDYITLEKIVKEREKPSRFEHSLGVVEVSEVLARRFRLDVELSRMIGIFHDYNRYMDGDDMLSFCRKRGIAIEKEEEENPMLLHGAVAAWYFPRITNNWNEKAQLAIRHHTLASRDRHIDDNDRLEIWGKANLEEMVLDVIRREEEYSYSINRDVAKVTLDCKAFLLEGGKFAH